MKVKIEGKSARLLDDGEIVRPGREYDLDDAVANTLIKNGHASPVVTVAKPDPIETASPEPATEKPKTTKPRAK